MLLLALFAFLHFDGIIQDIFSYTTSHECEGGAFPLSSSFFNYTLLQLDQTTFKEGIQALRSFSFIKLGSSKGVYAIHPLIHAWGRDRMTLEDKKKHCLMAYAMLACSLKKDFKKQPKIKRILVIHLRANMHHGAVAKKEKTNDYFDNAYEKFGNC